MQKHCQTKQKLNILFAIIFISGLTIHASPSYGSQDEKIEAFRCGSIGGLTLTTLAESPDQALKNTAEAYLVINDKNILYTGVIHSFMGGNDRTFTISPSQDFRRPDETAKENTLILSIISGYVYGKKREQITIYTLNEAMTCIRENP